MSERSYSSRDSSRSHSRTQRHGGGSTHGPSGTQIYASGGYAASTTSLDTVRQQGLGGVPYMTTSPRAVPASIPSPRIDTNVHHPPRATHVKHDSTTSYGSSIDGRSSYSSSTSTSPSSYSPSPRTPYNSSPLNPNRPPPMQRSNTDTHGIVPQADGSYYIDRSDDERNERHARRKQDKLRRAKSHSDMGSTYSNDTASTYSAHVPPPVPALPGQYAGSMNGSVKSSNFGEPETPRAQALSMLEGNNPHASSHRTKSTRSRRDKDGDDASRYGGGSDAGSMRSSRSKRAPSVASSSRRRAPSVGSSHRAPSVQAPSMAGSQYAMQPYVAPPLTAGQTPIPGPPLGSVYSFGTPSVAGFQSQLAHSQNQVAHAQTQVAHAQQAVQGATYQQVYTKNYDVQHVPGSNVYNVGTSFNVFVNSAEDLGKVGKELNKMDKAEKNLEKNLEKAAKGAGSLIRNVLLKKRRSFDH